MYESRELTFCKVEEFHLDYFKELKDDSWMMTHQKTIINRADQQAWFDHLDDDPNCPKNLVLSVLKNTTLIGCYKVLRIDYISRSADVGWDLLADFRGKNLGKDIVAGGANFCFDILNLRRLNAEILETNIPSQKCAEATGFVLEGVKREAVHKPEGFVDSQSWGLLFSEIKS